MANKNGSPAIGDVIDGEVELYRRYRPRKLSEMVGQRAAVEALQGLIDADRIPHALMLTGPSGVGKTTAARILRRHLKCTPTCYREINAASSRGIDTVREIEAVSKMPPIPPSKTRIYYLDECQSLTGDAQNALLKLLEDPRPWVYFFLATTDPHKLKRTIHTRCTAIAFKAMSHKDLHGLVMQVAKAEGIAIDEAVVEKIVEVSEGSARAALVLLHKVRSISDEQGQMGAIVPVGHQEATIDLCRLLMRGANWSQVAAALKSITEDHESVRRGVLGYAQSVMLGGGKGVARAALVAEEMRLGFYDSGKPGLVLACYRITSA